jgi:hypothetical protein
MKGKSRAREDRIATTVVSPKKTLDEWSEHLMLASIDSN